MSNIIKPDILNRKSVRAFFSTKKVGADSFDISFLTGISVHDIYLPIQKHTDEVHVMRFGSGRKVADAVLTRRKNILVGVAVADCVPILLYDPVRMICGAVHAGWRGVAGGILKNTLRVMISDFYSRPEDIIMAIGPAIRWCCYSVGREVFESVRSASGDGDYYKRKGNNICLDLPSANRLQALSAGLDDKNICMSDECTYCHPERYYSYRYSKGPTGRQGGFIGMFD